MADDQVPRPGPGEVRVGVLAAGVSFTDAMLRAGSYLGVPKPSFTPGYELVGVVEELGPGCSTLRVGDRIGSLTVWGADAQRVCVLERPRARRSRSSPRRRVLVYGIQKLRERHQVLPVSGRRRALPVGGGPRNPDWFREDFRALLELLREGKIHPVVAERMPLAEVRRAHELLESSASKGKLVLVP
jgi:NADPH:quinone reductase-like Zn-dependent oxidoreductase